MPTISETIERLLPNGTHYKFKEEGWDQVPVWPPDLFAVAATIVEQSGCYTSDRYSGRENGSLFFGKKYRRKVAKAARDWHESGKPSKFVQTNWDRLIAAGTLDLLGKGQAWTDAAMYLMAISDVAAAGMGHPDSENMSIFSTIALMMHKSAAKRHKETDLNWLNSLCVLVPPEVACVQPKSLTSQVGCSLRSLSHHLALLPGKGIVATKWNIGYSSFEHEHPLNLLIVPLPYNIPGNSIRESGRIDDDNSKTGHFLIDQKWLPEKNRETEVFEFLSSLIDSAAEQVDRVHGVVLPELALDEATAEKVATKLANKFDLEIFISGVLSAPSEAGAAARNQAFSSIFVDRQSDPWLQSKHHRWRLDGNQIRRYHFGHALDPSWKWWEEIDIEKRELNFYVFRKGATLAVLVCEDLARIDPVQPAIRSIGPNLVVALLFDGPQKVSRWPGKYATILSDDPGSSVLTVTSLGMVNRSFAPGDNRYERCIALWKDPVGGERELLLPDGSLGLVLSLVNCDESNWTLDGRSDGSCTVRISLGGIHAVTLDNVPPWLKYA